MLFLLWHANFGDILLLFQSDPCHIHVHTYTVVSQAIFPTCVVFPYATEMYEVMLNSRHIEHVQRAVKISH